MSVTKKNSGLMHFGVSVLSNLYTFNASCQSKNCVWFITNMRALS